MRATIILSSLALLRAVVASAEEYSPYSDPLFGLSDELLLVKRQSCRSGYTNCASLGASNACCPSDTNCALDQAGHVACCPFNAVCTGSISGTISGSATQTTTTGFILGGTTTTSATSFQTADVLPTTGVAGGGSTVPNAPYPFVYIPTSYANAALCSSYVSNCQAQSTACLSSLAGVNGVTISGFGGGTTVQGSTGTALSSASSVCSSLSLVACYGAQESQCTNFGGATGTATTFTQNGGPRQTGCPGLVYAAGAGAVVGVLGALA